MDFFLALLPILVLIGLIVGAKKSVVFSAAVALLALIFVGFWWGLDTLTMSAAGLRGLFVATEIILIVFSALLIVEIIRRQGLFARIQRLFTTISNDYRVLAIIIGFALVYFIEGAAGFGTPAIVVVPILVALAFKPIHAVSIALVADTIPVSFGAVGLPITFGIDSVLQGIAPDHASLTATVILSVAALNILFSTLLAVIIVGLSVFLKERSIHSFFAAIPFAIFAGLTVSLIAYVTAWAIGPELPSILGGLIGLFIISFAAKKGFLTPKATASNSHLQLNGSMTENVATDKGDEMHTLSSRTALWRSLYPYLLLIALLILTRLPVFRIGELLQSFTIGSSEFLGTNVMYSIAPLYSAATLLLLSAFITLWLARKRIGASVVAPLGVVLRKVTRPYLALFLVLAFVQIFIYSDAAGTTAAMPVVIAEGISAVSGAFWPFLVPFVGALGSFLAGSATVSNLIFSGLHYDIARQLSLEPAVLLSLQTIGASSGNMIALHNIVAALAIAGIAESQSHKIIRANIIPLLILLIAAGIMGLIITVIF